ncbi:hydrogenase expression protein HypF [Streptomyces sp. CA2R106]|uniref:hydrogenase expression protein HypF n=1 Tax=Streptomyces sp. CA2R106 TaxID=3120153 RepID=UPI003008D566
MLGDDAQPATSDGPRARATSGPRHAAPRKSLLTKLHVPAGKAVALAAMPTAVLMGMGLTPHLAQADEPSTPSFAPGACVSQSETPSPTASGQDTKDSSKSSAKDSAKSTKKADQDSTSGTATPTPTASPEGDRPAATASPSPTATSGDSAKKSTPTATASPTPTATSSYNPLDPLGLGDLLSGLLGGKKSDPTPTATPTTADPTPTASATTPAPDPASTSKTSGSGTTSSKSSTGTKDSKDTKSTAEKAVKGLTDATATPKATATPSPSTTASDGKQGYPCPTYDAKALADAKTEGGIPLLPDEPWTLKSSILTLHGLNYDGIVQVKTASGEVKDVLKFTTTGIDIGDLDQFVVGPGGKGHTEVKAAKGSTSTITGGTTTLYTESLSGNLLGLIPITFTPKSPPPLTLPELFFTNVTVINAGQFGGNLHVPGMQVLPGQP